MSEIPTICHYPSHRPPVNVPLAVLGEHDCAYLPGRVAQSRAFWASGLSGDMYHQFMDAGFRRSGRLIYQPICRGCRACVPIRVPVEQFSPSKSQRRCWRRNEDLRIEIGDPEPTDEKFELYKRYQIEWHDKSAAEEDRTSFESFLYDSPVQSLEFCYRDQQGKLLAVGICDISRSSLSSVYVYHDPAASKRGLGTFTALYEIAKAKSAGIPYYYLGFWVADCAKMQYKATYRPYELLDSDGVWRAGAP